MKKITLSSLFTAILILFISCNREMALYVSPSGNNTNPGTKNEPLQTLEGAKMAVRNALKEKQRKSVTVYFAEGTYPMEQPVKFSSEDSGSEQFPIIFKAAKGKIPVFSGSKPVNQWSLLNDDKILSRLNPAMRGKIYVVSLRKLSNNNTINIIKSQKSIESFIR